MNKIKKYLKKRQLISKSNVIFNKGSDTDVSTHFEGYNRLASNAVLYNSIIGKYSYLGADSKLSNVKIGRYTCIGPNVKNIIGEHPTSKFVSVHPAFFSKRKQIGITFVSSNKFNEFRYADTQNKYSIVIENDVWIGADSLFLEGIKIGNGAIIAAGAIVTRDVPPYAIVGGVPAKIIRYRFGEEDIKFLLRLQWWNKPLEWIKLHVGYFDDIEQFRKVLKNED